MRTPTENFNFLRNAIVSALQTAGIVEGNLLLNTQQIPDVLSGGFSAAVVNLIDETGKNGTSKRYAESDIVFEIFLMVDSASDRDDPDTDLYELKEAFRTAYIAAAGKDFGKIEYYNGQVDVSHPVRIAKLKTEKI